MWDTLYVVAYIILYLKCLGWAQTIIKVLAENELSVWDTCEDILVPTRGSETMNRKFFFENWQKIEIVLTKIFQEIPLSPVFVKTPSICILKWSQWSTLH